MIAQDHVTNTFHGDIRLKVLRKVRVARCAMPKVACCRWGHHLLSASCGGCWKFGCLGGTCDTMSDDFAVHGNDLAVINTALCHGTATLRAVWITKVGCLPSSCAALGRGL
ncbi:hypothetical protein PAXRUDRAFT_313826 [Paxillus rubicundulus Ve08.2h10]|uniref:Uncharacterized protein n=1 Tax=Paxillus rubicundulus Ve08.2h10 TaxID=930991 RepID=A0A0D0DSD4_9AGAM|nr:hypothetical protein PAXRUDRAFT_313826 [Paxillus rubicundulus Ve08.2h10]